MKIVAVHKEDGKITKYKLDNGKLVNKDEAINLVQNGSIEQCHIGNSKNNEPFVVTDRDKEGENKITNLDDLPTF